MSSDWLAEELLPTIELEEIEVRALGTERLSPEDFKKEARVAVAVHEPRWQNLGNPPLRGTALGVLWLVRLGFEFAPLIHPWHIMQAHCQAYITPARESEPPPLIYDLYPKNLYESESRTVSVKFGPAIEVTDVIKLSLGELSTDIRLGQVVPTTIGSTISPIENNRQRIGRIAQWILKADQHPIVGLRHFWLALEQPEGCSGIDLRVRVDATIQRSVLSVPVGPTQKAWDSRRKITIR